MDSFPPAHGPARHLDDLVAGLRVDDDDPEDGPPHEPPELPAVVEAVTGRAHDLHRLADRLGAEGTGGGGDTTLPAVALLRAHAEKVDDLAEHLLVAGAERTAHEQGSEAAQTDSDDPEPGDAGPGASGSLAHPPRGVPRSVG